jgi:hypothetical protein
VVRLCTLQTFTGKAITLDNVKVKEGVFSDQRHFTLLVGGLTMVASRLNFARHRYADIRKDVDHEDHCARGWPPSRGLKHPEGIHFVLCVHGGVQIFKNVFAGRTIALEPSLSRVISTSNFPGVLGAFRASKVNHR